MKENKISQTKSRRVKKTRTWDARFDFLDRNFPVVKKYAMLLVISYLIIKTIQGDTLHKIAELGSYFNF